MTGRNAVKEWREHEREYDLTDKGYARLSWNFFVDRMEREERATRKQTDRWPTPKECK